ncbi:methyltransferase domain-containing protein [Flavitalea flava]
MGLLQKFLSGKDKNHNSKTLNTWKEIEYFDEEWKNRIQQMASYIPPNTKSIMDIGCGKMWLKEYLPDGCKYFGVDYINRGTDSHLFDLNNYEFPDFTCDLAFVSGCLEYIDDYKWLIDEIAVKNKECIISYCLLDVFTDLKEREKLHWRNHLSEMELIDLFSKNEMYLIKRDKTVTNNYIYVLRK